MQLDWKALYQTDSWGEEELEVPFDEEEVKATIFSMGSDKSPGPDGYFALFLRNFGQS